MAIVVIEISSTDEDEEECKKAEMQAKKMATTVGRRKRREYVKVGKVEAPVDDEDEDDDDCFILPYNPFLDDQLDLKRRLYLDDPPLSDDVTVVAERGQVACRDYPHSRHLCTKYPFSKTPHPIHCQKCYCYVCDEPAPCRVWDKHCHAYDKSCYWKTAREEQRSTQDS
ncbi:RPM1 interacting protein 13-like [Musa acuminata AAA Group]|uniref:RPM1 interacting protein 13-like n=1 Tax=Musa acuminata AAA Group TaxID=214697 RepID=UPI0031D41CA7